MADAGKGLEERVDGKTTTIVFNKNGESSQGLNKKSTGIKLNIGIKRKQADLTNSSSDKLKVKTSKEDETNKLTTHGSTGISLALSSKIDKEKNEAPLQKKKGTVLKAFADDSDSEEEMPKEARMRMRNIGRDTPTSAGPNSYNKGKEGFSNRNKMWDKDLKPRIHLEKPPDKQ